MKEQGFFDDLRKELRDVELRVTETIIKAMHEHYDLLLQSGKTEAEARKELGDPKDVAKEIFEQEALMIADEKSASKLQKIDANGFRMSFVADEIKMNFINMDMEIGESQSEEIQFVGVSKEDIEKCFTIEVNQNVLTIKDRYKFNLVSYVRHRRQQAKLLLPRNYRGEINLGIINSNVIAENIRCGHMTVNAMANLMSARGIACDSFKLRCSAFNLKADKSSLGNCDIACTASTLNFTDVDCSKLDLKNAASTVEFVRGTAEALFRNL